MSICSNKHKPWFALLARRRKQLKSAQIYYKTRNVIATVNAGQLSSVASDQRYAKPN